MKDLYSSMDQNSEHINQDSSLRWNKTSTQQQTNSETVEQQKSNNWTPVGLLAKTCVGFQTTWHKWHE